MVFVLLLLNADIKAQKPVIAYNPATTNLTPGTPVSITPTSSGVPNTVYGTVTTFSGSKTGPGSGSLGYVSGSATVSRYNDIEAVVGDAAGNIYIAESENNDIRKIDVNGNSSVFAGDPTVGNTGGYVDDIGTKARF